jgi:hypothetical protein
LPLVLERQIVVRKCKDLAGKRLITALLLGSADIRQTQALSLHVSDDAGINQKNSSENGGC